MEKSILKSAILMLVIVAAVVVGYEIHLRNRGLEVSYDDGPALWSNKRTQVYGDKEDQVVFIGSSRIKYDLDLDTWNQLTGIEAVQLACVGSTPLPILKDLANDPEFKGRLVIDVTEPIFFSSLPFFLDRPTKNLKYYHDHTIAQDASFRLHSALESQFVFLDEENLSMNAQLSIVPYIVPQLQDRPGAFGGPIFPIEFGRTTFDRQTYMTDHFVADTAQVNMVKGIWAGLAKMPMPPPMNDQQLLAFIQDIKKSTDKIKARGGDVIFVRTPSSGDFRQMELAGFARPRYWDQLLKVTQCPGIHFEDDAATKNLICPEFSHLNLADAKTYTKAFVRILSQHDGWDVQSEKLLTKI
ncbi:hypothetical protein [Flavobacterium sp.]|uniref:hypothetical protein n=1 Tax=Flavobacterium sp. TaxID=239 RepID=UPI0039E41FF0